MRVRNMLAKGAVLALPLAFAACGNDEPTINVGPPEHRLQYKQVGTFAVMAELNDVLLSSNGSEVSFTVERICDASAEAAPPVSELFRNQATQGAMDMRTLVSSFGYVEGVTAESTNFVLNGLEEREPHDMLLAVDRAAVDGDVLQAYIGGLIIGEATTGDKYFAVTEVDAAAVELSAAGVALEAPACPLR